MVEIKKDNMLHGIHPSNILHGNNITTLKFIYYFQLLDLLPLASSAATSKSCLLVRRQLEVLLIQLERHEHQH